MAGGGLKFLLIVLFISISTGKQCDSNVLSKGICFKFYLCDMLTRLPSYSVCESAESGEKFCCPYVSIPHFPKQELLLSSPNCGKFVSNRVAHGEETEIDEFAWTALLRYIRTDSGEIVYKCGGSLLNRLWVLTAAHCFIYRPYVHFVGVRLGEWDIRTDPDYVLDANNTKVFVAPHVDREVDLIVTHESFSASTFLNDIALLRLVEPVTFSHMIQPICLPLSSDTQADDLVGAAVKVVGWGHTEFNNTISPVKRKALVTVFNNSRCEEKFASIKVQFKDTQICALGKNYEDTCKGDSGGPLLMDAYDENHYSYMYVAGVVSFGKIPCGGKSEVPGVYTRVPAFIDWIKDTITAYS